MVHLEKLVADKKLKEISKKEIKSIIAMMNNFIRFFSKFFEEDCQIVKELLDNQVLILYMKFMKFPLLGLQSRFSKTHKYNLEVYKKIVK